jgi:hypothetical protein
VSAKVTVALGVLISGLALPHLMTVIGGANAVGLSTPIVNEQRIHGLEIDLYQTQPTCDPVNDPSSCRSS